MQTAQRQHLFRFGICVTIPAQMAAGIIGTDITGKITGTFCSCAFFLRYAKAFSDGLLIVTDPHAAAAVGSVRSKLLPLSAGPDGHAVGGSDSDQFPAQLQALFFCDLPGFREVPSDFGIQIYKTDNNRFCIPIQFAGNLFKSMDMIFHRVPL